MNDFKVNNIGSEDSPLRGIGLSRKPEKKGVLLSFFAKASEFLLFF
jgi:hypothetical protein